jgi:hypothetical protein
LPWNPGPLSWPLHTACDQHAQLGAMGWGRTSAFRCGTCKRQPGKAAWNVITMGSTRNSDLMEAGCRLPAPLWHPTVGSEICLSLQPLCSRCVCGTCDVSPGHLPQEDELLGKCHLLAHLLPGSPPTFSMTTWIHVPHFLGNTKMSSIKTQ